MEHNTQEAQMGGIGTKIIVDTLDLLTNLTPPTKIHYKKPISGDVGSWDATFEAPTSLYYITTSADDLDEIGTWCLQVGVDVVSWVGRGKKTYEMVILSNC